MVIVPIGEQYFIVPGNTSKKQIEEKIRTSRRLVAIIVSSFLSLVGLMIWYLSFTQLKEMYDIVNKPIPSLSQFSPAVSLAVGVLAYFFLHSILHKEVDFVSVKTNEGKLKITPVLGMQKGLWVFLVLGISIAILTTIFAAPIYFVANSF